MIPLTKTHDSQGEKKKGDSVVIGRSMGLVIWGERGPAGLMGKPWENHRENHRENAGVT